jgi:UPF0755 protein
MNRRDIVAWTVASLLLLAFFFGGGIYLARQRFFAPGPLPEARNVMVPHGPQSEVGAMLEAAGVIEHVHEFEVAATLTRGEGPIKSAEFAFPAHASLRQVLTVLRTAKPVQHHLTIPEGFTAVQILRLIEHAETLAGDVKLPAEGSLLPESYAYDYGATRASVVERAKAAMDKTLAKVWADRAPDPALTTPADLLTLASIVERETARPEERPHIAAVFLNRLKRGMRLQSDPTVAYALTNGVNTLGKPLTRADLDVDSPYNTYRQAGLPPGPIDSPGIASLEAVAHPMQSDDLYFVADGTGGHAFAATLEDHNKNVAKFRALTPTAAVPVTK